MERLAWMRWPQRLKRLFNIDIELCGECGGAVKVTSSIEDRVVIGKILAPLQGKDTSVATNLLPASRAPPADLFG